MASLIPVAIYGLTVPCDDEPIPASMMLQGPATIRITMAAIDPTLTPTESAAVPRATLKIIQLPMDSDDESDDDDDMMLGDSDEDMLGDSDESDDDGGPGPSDPDKSPKARMKAAAVGLRKLVSNGISDLTGEVPNGVNGVKASKGKGKATDSESDEDDIEDDMDMEANEFVLCTLDPSKNCQQPLDITIPEDEKVYFRVTGTHAVHLTGNILIDAMNPDDMSDEDDSVDPYDLSPDEDELDLYGDANESDDLDDLADPRITELADDEAAPALIPAAAPKGKNKRPAEDNDSPAPAAAAAAASAAAASTNGDGTLSKSAAKKLRKKMKLESGASAAVEPGSKEKASPKSDKRVSFSENLVQGPSGTSAEAKKDTPKEAGKSKTPSGPRVVKGVTIDDKTLGEGPHAKAGDRVHMRYIGKLDKDKRVFDSNKGGPSFSCRLGKGEVIAGWDIGIAGMQMGGARRLTIPAELAYGKKGSGKDIPPNATLVFDVKLLKIG